MIIEKQNLNDKVFIVAEIGNNHEGSYALAEEMIGLAFESGADAVKFQTFIPELFVSSEDSARLERMKKFQLSFNEFESLCKIAKKLGIIFFSTPLDLESAKFLNSIQEVFKIASADNSFFPLLELVSSFRKPTIVSTGLGDFKLLTEVKDILTKNDNGDCNLAFLHCVSAYPVPLDQVNLSAIKTLQQMFPQNIIGYSDHTLGIDTCAYAVASGARIIEKHFTINKNHSDFRDHQLSADPSDFKKMVATIRQVEIINGTGKKVSQECEEALRPAIRRSLACAFDLKAGTTLTNENLIWLRPGDGFLAGEESKVIGKKIIKDLQKGSIVRADHLAK